MSQSAFQGLRTAIYRVPDLQKAKEWYTAAVGFPPYFDEPFYVGFNVGGYEMGLLPLEAGEQHPGPGGVTTYWGVEDAHRALARLRDLGATEHEPVADVGEGIRVATVRDPFGNVFGIIENPHFRVDTP